MKNVCSSCASKIAAEETEMPVDKDAPPSIELNSVLFNKLKQRRVINLFGNKQFNTDNLTGNDLTEFRKLYNQKFKTISLRMEALATSLKEETEVGIYLLPVGSENEVLNFLRLKIKDYLASSTKNVGYRFIETVNLTQAGSDTAINGSIVAITLKKMETEK